MTLFGDVLHFFRRERIWTLLFLFLLALYGYFSLTPKKEPVKPQSEAMERLRLAEDRLREQIQTTGGIQPFLRERPTLLWGFTIFTAALMMTLLGGMTLNVVWIFNPRWRKNLQTTAGPPEARGWGIGTVFKIILLFIVISLGLSFFLALIRTLFFSRATPNVFVLTHTTLSDLAAVALVAAFIRWGGGKWQDLGFRGVRFWKDLGLGMAGYAAVLPLFLLMLVGLLVLVTLLAYEPPPHPLVEVFLEEERRPLLIAYSILLACVIGPVVEEIFFRGFCYPALKRRWGVGRALVLSSAFFSLIHQNAFAFLPVFVLGLGLGYLYEKRGNLLPSIALHIVHNTVFISYFFLAKEIATAG